MNPPTRKTDSIVEAYLKQVSQSLTGMPRAYRDELVADLRAHIEAEREGLADDSEAQVRQVLERLGPPDMVAAAAKKDEADAPLWSPRARRIAWIAVIALVTLLVLAGLIVYFFFASSSSVHPNR